MCRVDEAVQDLRKKLEISMPPLRLSRSIWEGSRGGKDIRSTGGEASKAERVVAGVFPVPMQVDQERQVSAGWTDRAHAPTFKRGAATPGGGGLRSDQDHGQCRRNLLRK